MISPEYIVNIFCMNFGVTVLDGFVGVGELCQLALGEEASLQTGRKA